MMQVNLHNAWLQISSCILASTFVFGNTIKVTLAVSVSLGNPMSTLLLTHELPFIQCVSGVSRPILLVSHVIVADSDLTGLFMPLL